MNPDAGVNPGVEIRSPPQRINPNLILLDRPPGFFHRPLGEMGKHVSTSLGLANELDRAARKELRGQFVYGATQQPLVSSFRMKQASSCLLSPFGLSFKTTQQSPAGQPAVVVAGGTDVPPGEVVTPTTPPPAPEPESGGDCAGNSDHNPGNSQNCSH